VQHLEGGIVGEILVHDGDLVKAGDVLIRLDDAATRASFAIVSGQLHELVARLARLMSERDGAKTIRFPDSLAVQRSDPAISVIVNGQNSLFEARRKGRLGQVSILRQRIVQTKEQIRGLEAQQVAKRQQADIITRSIRKKQQYAGSVVSGDTMDALERQKAQLEGEIGELQSQIAKTRGSIGEIEQQILQLDKEFREKVLSEIRETQTQSAELRERKTALHEKLRRVDIRAPKSGRVHNMSIFTIGGIVSPAKPILQIIPENDHLVVEAKIEPTDVDQVKIGQEAGIRLSAFDSRTTPMLDGVVKKISAAQVVDPNTNMSYFTIEIVIQQDQLARLKDGQKLVPGMPVEVFIRTGDRTPLDYILKPFMVQLERAGREQ
jgi:HlyD family secretion protein